MSARLLIPLVLVPLVAGRAAAEEPTEEAVAEPAEERFEAPLLTACEWAALLDDERVSAEGCSDEPVVVGWWDALDLCNIKSQVEGLSPCYALFECNGNAGEPGFACDELRSTGRCEGYRLPTSEELATRDEGLGLPLTSEWHWDPTPGALTEPPQGPERRRFRPVRTPPAPEQIDPFDLLL